MRHGWVSVGLALMASFGCHQRPSGRFGTIGHKGAGEFGGVTPAPARLSGVAYGSPGGELHVTDEEGRERVVRTDGATTVVVRGAVVPSVEAVPEGSQVRAVCPGPSTEVPAKRIEVVRTKR